MSKKSPVYGPWATRSASGEMVLNADGQAGVAALIEKYKGWLPNLVRGRHAGTFNVLRYHGYDNDDLHQMCVAAVCKSALTFDPSYRVRFKNKQGKMVEKFVDFSTYAHRAVGHEFKRALGLINRNVKASVRVDGISGGTDPFDLPDDTEASEERRLHADHARQRVAQGLKTLHRRHRIVIAARFGLGTEQPGSLNDVRAAAGMVSKEMVRQIQQDAFVRLRKALESKEAAELTEAVA